MTETNRSANTAGDWPLMRRLLVRMMAASPDPIELPLPDEGPEEKVTAALFHLRLAGYCTLTEYAEGEKTRVSHAWITAAALCVIDDPDQWRP